MRPSHALLASVLIAGAVGVSSLALALEGPMRRPGLWEMKMTSEGEQGRDFTTQICVDPSFEQAHGMFSSPMAQRPGAGREDCSVREFHPTAGGFSFHSVCSANGATVETKGQSIGDFQNHYHLDIDMNRTPGGERHMAMDGRWLGPCPAGQSGGDMSMVLPDGRVMRMGAGMRPGG